MHDDRLFVEERLERALRERLWPAIHSLAVPFDVAAWLVPPAGRGDGVGEPVPVATALAAGYVPVAVGDAWGPPWGTTWFQLTGRVPAEWAGREVEAVIDLGFTDDVPGFQAEGLVHTADGVPVKAREPAEHRRAAARRPPGRGRRALRRGRGEPDRSAGSDHPARRPATAGTSRSTGSTRLELAVLRTRGVGARRRPRGARRSSCASCRWTTRGAGRSCARSSARSTRWTCTTSPERPTAARASAERRRWRRPAYASAHRVSAVGHAHIDSAWLWPVRETIRKVRPHRRQRRRT